MAAAEASDLSDASDETVEQQHGSEHDTDESDVDDGGAADQPAVVITRHACGGEDTLTVVSVALAQSRGGKAADKRQKYGAWCNVSANPEHTHKTLPPSKPHRISLTNSKNRYRHPHVCRSLSARAGMAL